jgi:Clostridium P-47 protein
MGQEITLGGWDTANVVKIDVLNGAIVKQGTTPPNFSLTETPDSIVGVWGPWQVTTGRTGEYLQLHCPIISGTGSDGTGTTVDLAGASMNIQLTLASVKDSKIIIKDPTAKPPPVTVPPTPPKPATKLIANTVSTQTDPAVLVLSISPPSLRNTYQFLFEDWFNANIGDFGQMFHAIVLDLDATNPDFQWLKPTDISYAVETTVDGKTTVFAALCQTDGDPMGSLTQSIDPAIVANMPAGCNSVVAISGEKFAEHILRKGAMQIIKGSKSTDFDIIGLGLVVTNNTELTWLDMTLQDGVVVSPKIAPGCFRLSVVEDQIEVEFTQMTFSHPITVGNDLFTLSFAQYYNIALDKDALGGPVLRPVYPTIMVNGVAVPIYVSRPVITCNPDQAAQDFERTMAIISIVLSILPLGCGIFKAGSWVLKAGSALASRITTLVNAGGNIFRIAVDASEVANMTDAALAGSDNLAAAAAFSSTLPADAGIAPLINRIAMWSGMASAFTGGLAATIKLETNGDDRIKDAPTIDDFLKNVLGATHWPGATNWEIKSAELAQSLLLHGELST